MTYSSCRIEVLGHGRHEPEEPTYITTAPLFASLGWYPRHFSTWTLIDWAKAHGAHCGFIDNCWVRVEVDANQLRAFLRDVFRAEAAAINDIEPRISDAKRYTIVAEEF